MQDFIFKWEPNWHFPYSGPLRQDVRPYTQWFFEGIRPPAGHGEVEQQAFEVASYGKQLGLILEVLLPLAKLGLAKAKTVSIDADNPGTTFPKVDLTVEKAQTSLHELEQIYGRIEELKQRDTWRLQQGLRDEMEALLKQDRHALGALLKEFQGKKDRLDQA